MRKELLPRLRWREVTQALDDPAPVEVVANSASACHNSSTVRKVRTQSNCSFSVRMNRSTQPFSFRLSHERRRRFHAQESALGLEVIAQVLAAVIMPEANARRGIGPEADAVVAPSLPDGLQGLEPCRSLRRMKAHAFGRAVIDRDEHRHLALLDGDRCGVVGGPDFIGPFGDDRAPYQDKW